MPVKPAPSIGPADFLHTRPRSGTVEFDFTFRLITPMFGGGVEVNGPQKPHDPITPIRIPSIRGQLRFWWRACNPAKAITAEELFTAEEALWGSTTAPSKLQIALLGHSPAPKRVDIFQEYPLGSGRMVWRIKQEYAQIAYGVFPLQPPQRPKNDAQKQPGVLWRIDEPVTLRITCPRADGKSLHETLSAWSLFGGLGGRTRRGFGALEFVSSSDPDFAIAEAGADFLQRLTTRPKINGVPSLAGASHRVCRTPRIPHPQPEDAWHDAIHRLQQFRQGLGLARNGQQKSPGRSRWPEADQLRRLAQTHHPRHVPQHPVHKFPRAAFGLPLVFHFKDSDPRSSDSVDPSDMTLLPEDAMRFASPLILRPQRRPDNRYEGLALVLANTRPPERLRLDGLSTGKGPIRRDLSPAEARMIQPLQEHGSANPDLLQAFLHFFGKSNNI